MDISGRLRMVIDASSSSVSDFCRKHELSSRQQAAIYGWLDGRIPRTPGFLDICRQIDISPVWLLVGVGGRSFGLKSKPSEISVADRLSELLDDPSISPSGQSRIRRSLKGGGTPKTDSLVEIARTTDRSLLWLLAGIGDVAPYEARENGPQAEEDEDDETQIVAVTAEDIPLRRFVSLISRAWQDPEVRGWLQPTLRRVERELFETFQDLAEEEKSAMPRSNAGSA